MSFWKYKGTVGFEFKILILFINSNTLMGQINVSTNYRDVFFQTQEQIMMTVSCFERFQRRGGDKKIVTLICTIRGYLFVSPKGGFIHELNVWVPVVQFSFYVLLYLRFHTKEPPWWLWVSLTTVGVYRVWNHHIWVHYSTTKISQFSQSLTQLYGKIWS